MNDKKDNLSYFKTKNSFQIHMKGVLLTKKNIAKSILTLFDLHVNSGL